METQKTGKRLLRPTTRDECPYFAGYQQAKNDLIPPRRPNSSISYRHASPVYVNPREVKQKFLGNSYDEYNGPKVILLYVFYLCWGRQILHDHRNLETYLKVHLIYNK